MVLLGTVCHNDSSDQVLHNHSHVQRMFIIIILLYRVVEVPRNGPAQALLRIADCGAFPGRIVASKHCHHAGKSEVKARAMVLLRGDDAVWRCSHIRRTSVLETKLDYLLRL